MAQPKFHPYRQGVPTSPSYDTRSYSAPSTPLPTWPQWATGQTALNAFPIQVRHQNDTIKPAPTPPSGDQDPPPTNSKTPSAPPSRSTKQDEDPTIKVNTSISDATTVTDPTYYLDWSTPRQESPTDLSAIEYWSAAIRSVQ